jgi:hypothetical protein
MPTTAEVMAEVSPGSLLSGTLELRGLCYRSYFGPRMCVRSITIFIEVCGALNQGFPFSPLEWRPMMVLRGD